MAIASWLASVLINLSCSSALCQNVHAVLGKVYMSIFVVLVVIFWSQIRGALRNLKTVFAAVQSTQGVGAGAGGGPNPARTIEGEGGRDVPIVN